MINSAIGVLVLGMVSINLALAADYTGDEAEQTRIQKKGLEPVANESYATEMQRRIQAMSVEERALFFDMNKMRAENKATENKKSKGRGGGGKGDGKKHRRGKGANGDSDNMSQHEDGDGQGYGRGYRSRQGGGR